MAGITRCLAPAAEIIVTNEFAIAGSQLESDLVTAACRALGLGVDIFHLTMAAPSRQDLPLIAFTEWLRLMRQYRGDGLRRAGGQQRLPAAELAGRFL